MARLLEVAIGMGIFVLAQSAWVTGHSRFDWGSPWVLEPAIGIAFCLGLFMLTTAVLAARRREPVSWGSQGVLLGVGAIPTMVVALFLVGPGNLWPLVLLLDTILIIVAIFAGAVMGNAFRRNLGHAA